MTLAPCAGISPKPVGWHIAERLEPRERQLATGGDTSRQHVGQGIAGLRADEPPLHHGRHLVNPRHGHSITRNVHKHDVLIDLGQCLHQLVLLVGQFILPAVVTLTVLKVCLIQTSKDDDHVGLLRLLNSLSTQLGIGAVLGNATANGHPIIALHGVAYVTAGVVERWVLGVGCWVVGFEAVQRQDLMLHLE